MLPHLFLLFVTLTAVSCTETTTMPVLTEVIVTIPSTHKPIDATLISRQLVNLTRLDWNNKADFQKYIFGDEEDKDYFHDVAAQLLDTASTLWIMNLTEEYTKVHTWVVDKFPYTNTSKVDASLDLTPIRLLRNLISLHALTGDTIYLEKAQVMLTALGQYSRPEEGSGVWSYLYLEYHYLSELTGNADYAQWAVKQGEMLSEDQFKTDFLHSTEYLLAKAKHAYLDPTPDRIDRLRHQIDTIFANPSGWRLQQINDTSLWYLNFYPYSKELLTMIAPRIAAFALTGVAIMKYSDTTGATSSRPLDTSDKWAAARIVRAIEDSSLMWQRALEMLDTYWILTESRIPIKVVPNGIYPDQTKGFYIYFASQMPEVYFYLWRLTGREQYRKMAWWMAQAMIKYGWDEENKKIAYINENGGHITINGRFREDDLYKTLRYLYLTFQPNDQYPLDRWITSDWGNLFPVCNGKVKRC